jgi:hypothetical protein
MFWPYLLETYCKTTGKISIFSWLPSVLAPLSILTSSIEAIFE